MIVCRRCHRLCTTADFRFVPVKTLADCLTGIGGDRDNPAWRTWEAAMQAGCAVCRHADYLSVDPDWKTEEVDA